MFVQVHHHYSEFRLYINRYCIHTSQNGCLHWTSGRLGLGNDDQTFSVQLLSHRHHKAHAQALSSSFSNSTSPFECRLNRSEADITYGISDRLRCMHAIAYGKFIVTGSASTAPTKDKLYYVKFINLSSNARVFVLCMYGPAVTSLRSCVCIHEQCAGIEISLSVSSQSIMHRWMRME